MDVALHILGLLLLFGACGIALLSLVLGLPGTFLIVVAAFVYAWATGFAAVHWSTVGWLLLLAVVGEGLEFAAGALGAAGAHPSRRVTIAVLAGGLAGGIIGTPFLFGIGSLLGALAGAFAGGALAVGSEGGTTSEALTAGWAALRGRFLGFVLKAAIAVVMVILLAVRVI